MGSASTGHPGYSMSVRGLVTKQKNPTKQSRRFIGDTSKLCITTSYNEASGKSKLPACPTQTFFPSTYKPREEALILQYPLRLFILNIRQKLDPGLRLRLAIRREDIRPRNLRQLELPGTRHKLLQSRRQFV